MKKSILGLVLLLSMTVFSQEIKLSQSLKSEMSAKDKEIVKLFQNQYEYTLKLDWKNAKCLSNNLGKSFESGTCLVSGVDSEEGNQVVISVNKIRHESGTGDATPELSVVLINYEL